MWEGICSLVNEGESNPVKWSVKVIKKTIENAIFYSIPVFCQQCETASCEAVCPRRAIARNSNGVLIVERGEVHWLQVVRDCLPCWGE